jgi:hypothetical protein
VPDRPGRILLLLDPEACARAVIDALRRPATSVFAGDA